MRSAIRSNALRNFTRIPYLPGTIASAILVSLAGAAQAAVVISDNATKNMTCSNGICEPTAADAVLNTGDLETVLASGNVEVTTTGSGVEANDIKILDPFSWNSNHKLTLEAHQGVRVDSAVTVEGQGGLSITTHYNAMLSFGRNGHVTFKNLTSHLLIGGYAYKLVHSVKSLAKAITRNPRGAYALANDYDAGSDGTYHQSPVGFFLSGPFEGLGNTISNLKIRGAGDLALFSGIGEYARISNITVQDADVTATKPGEQSLLGTLVANVEGEVTGAHATGSVTGSRKTSAGGLIGSASNRAYLIDDSASVTVVVGERSTAGGLAGGNGGSISECYAEGAVEGRDRNVQVGGLVGDNVGGIDNSYARGSARGGSDSGGLVGDNYFGALGPAPIGTSYSTGMVEATHYAGGLIGLDSTKGDDIVDTYWDTTTSGITSRSQGAGSPANDPGIKGLKTRRLQSGLPAGFDPKIWAENRNINNGLPYLINNPPPE